MKNNVKIEWVNPENGRHYKINLYQDLLGDLILRKEWGGNKRKGIQVQRIYCSSRQIAAKHLRALKKLRKTRGYTKPKIASLMRAS